MSETLKEVIADLQSREEKGKKEYGTTVDRTDFTHKQWLYEAYCEALDMALYLKRAMKDLE